MEQVQGRHRVASLYFWSSGQPSANEDLEWRNGAIPGLPARCRPSGLI